MLGDEIFHLTRAGRRLSDRDCQVHSRHNQLDESSGGNVDSFENEKVFKRKCGRSGASVRGRQTGGGRPPCQAAKLHRYIPSHCPQVSLVKCFRSHLVVASQAVFHEPVVILFINRVEVICFVARSNYFV